MRRICQCGCEIMCGGDQCINCQAEEDEERKLAEGWVWFLNSRKAHYVIGGRSLCGKWMYLGSSFEQGNDNSPDNCASCKRKLKKMKELVLANE